MESQFLQILAALGTALAAGFVVGAEREQRGEPGKFGGARTFPLYALAGAVGMLIGTWLLVTLALSVGALLAISYVRDTRPGEGHGMSTQVAALVTFGLGAMCTAEQMPLLFGERLLLVAAGATATLALLSFKQPLHGFIQRVSQEDVYATVKLLLLAVIVLPLLPDRELGPWEALNPRHIGLLVVLISGLSFAGYVAVRIFGARRGLGLTGLLGGLASSTAVTLTFSGRAREQPRLVSSCAVAIVLASSTMFPRALVEIYAVSGALGDVALWPYLATTTVGVTAGGVLYARSKGTGEDAPDPSLEIRNPFSVTHAVKFAAVFTVVLLISRGASFYLDTAGVYLAAVVTGLADVDAITLSIARMHASGTLDTRTAVEAAGTAAVTNTVSKALLAAVLGGPRLGARIAIAMLGAVGVGAAVLFLFVL
ncbi:MAG: MgtC/SapB family protein [Polyangiales bacterium]